MKRFLPIAFYLPQFHPTSENDEWWGRGFTEWTNVAKASKLYIGHYQPKVPADLGFYDLRIPEIQVAQSEMAISAGVEAFCYWHYWMGGGRRLLEKPLESMLNNPDIRIPFCLAWANHTWMRKNWNAKESRLSQVVLSEQTYPGNDDIDNHFYTMLPAFHDSRYYKVNGKLLFLIYAPEDLPDLRYFVTRWQELAIQNGLPGFFFIGRIVDGHPMPKDADVLNGYNYECIYSIFPYSRLRRAIAWVLHTPVILPFKSILKRYPIDKIRDSKIYPCAYTNWDNTPRLGTIGCVFHDPDPRYLQKHLEQLSENIQNQERIIFLKSWNEWAEGNYLEPDLKYGHGYLDALRNAVNG